MEKNNMNNINIAPMLNVYPDSIGKNLKDLVMFLNLDEMQNVFKSLYILPSLFNTDLDRGFSVIDYELNELLASKDNINEIKNMGIDLKLDFILNHASVLSKQFKDITLKGEDSKYIDFFINWNKFWDGHGEMTNEGYIKPEKKLIEDMHFRKKGLPILFVRFKNGEKVPFWNTFYQKVYYTIPSIEEIMDKLNIQYTSAELLIKKIEYNLQNNIKLEEIKLDELDYLKEKCIKILEENTKYLGQMDLNIKSPLVWEFYEDTLKKLSSYGASIVRLDAFAYITKEVGKKNFLNEPEVWDILDKVKSLAKENNITLLPEIHSKYEDKVHSKISSKGYMVYDFFLPGILIDAFTKKRTKYLSNWANEIIENNYLSVNMLGCHDGIPLLDLKGLLPDKEIEDLIKIVVNRGGYVKELNGEKNIYYQVNATYFSALGEDEKQLLLSRAIQMFMPGKPQIWYLDLFAGKNDTEALKKAGKDGHKEINRTNLSYEYIVENMNTNIVKQQLELIKFRNNFKAFNVNSIIKVYTKSEEEIIFEWKHENYKATLYANVKTLEYKIQTEE